MNSDNLDKKFLNAAFDEAFRSMHENLGGPFGAVIVKDGKIIGIGSNTVTSTNDPTAHAEIVAIRNACKETGTFDLAGATLYSTCEPCPMCLSAVYWAHISRICFASSRHDAENLRFIDNLIYKEIGLNPDKRSLVCLKIDSDRGVELFTEWERKKDKDLY